MTAQAITPATSAALDASKRRDEMVAFAIMAVLFAAAPLAYLALRWSERWRELREALGYTWLNLRYHNLVRELAARRRALADEVTRAQKDAQALEQSTS